MKPDQTRNIPTAMRRRLITISTTTMFHAERLFRDKLPLLITPAGPEIDIMACAQNRNYIAEQLADHGGILFRNFGLKTTSEFERFIAQISGETLAYTERSSPRTRVTNGNVYTSTDYPPDQSIFVHNENSYKRKFNQKIFFFCETPALEGGETPIADCREVYKRISPHVRKRFADKGWMYTRNYGEGLGLDWKTVFDTSDKNVVEEYCRENEISYEWTSDGGLKTRAVLPAVIKHPRTGETVWFNHATFFHVSTLEPSLRDDLLATVENEADLPTNTYYGDGSPIEPETLEELREAYHAATVSFPWQHGDILMLDNILVAHGRAPYEGPREIRVGMTELMSR